MELVYKAKSRIVSNNPQLNAGDGVFAKVKIFKGQYICSYSGELVDYAATKYCDPTYIFSWELGIGYKLIGDNKDGDLGHLCNSIHPDSPSVRRNAKFDNKSLKRNKGKKYHLKKRNKVDIIATKDIEIDEEIILDYGPGYWKVMSDFTQKGMNDKPHSIQERDERAKKRNKV